MINIRAYIERLGNLTFVIETFGDEMPIKYPKTIPIIVVITSLDPPFDLLKVPLDQNKEKKQGNCKIYASTTSLSSEPNVL